MKTLRVAFRCPHCSHAFLRGVGDIAGTTRCPKCCEKFPRLAGCRSGGDATAVRSEVCNRNQARNKRLIGPLVTHEVIRGDQVPHSTAEAKFKAKSAAKGWRASNARPEVVARSEAEKGPGTLRDFRKGVRAPSTI